MNPLLIIFGSSFVVGLSGAMMPGPVLTATLGEVMKRGFIAGPLIVFGHGILECGVLLLFVTGTGDWLLEPGVRQAVAWIGGGILLWMGGQMIWTAAAAARQALAASSHPVVSVHGPILVGMATTLSNPYFYIWWGTIGLGYAAWALEHGRVGLVFFYGGHILSDFAWYSLVALATASGRRVCSPAVYRWVLRTCGAVLMLIGWLFIRSV